jgi:cell division protein FtsW (lipid II flippase)
MNGYRAGASPTEIVLLLLTAALAWSAFVVAQQQMIAATHGGGLVRPPQIDACGTRVIQRVREDATRAGDERPFHECVEILDLARSPHSPDQLLDRGIRHYDVSAHARRAPVAELAVLLAIFLLLPPLLALVSHNAIRSLNHCDRASLPARPPWILPAVFGLLAIGLLLMYVVEPVIVAREAARLARNHAAGYASSTLSAWNAVSKYERLLEIHWTGIWRGALALCVAQELFAWKSVRSLVHRVRAFPLFLTFLAILLPVAVQNMGKSNQTSAISLGFASFITADLTRLLLLLIALRFLTSRGPLALVDRYLGFPIFRQELFRTVLRRRVFSVVAVVAAAIGIWTTAGEEYAFGRAAIGALFLVFVLLAFRAQWLAQFGYLAGTVAFGVIAWIASRDFGPVLVAVPVLIVLSLLRIRHGIVLVATLAMIVGGHELLYQVDDEFDILNHRYVERVELVRDPFQGAPNSMRWAGNSDTAARALWAAREGGFARFEPVENGATKIREIDTDLSFAWIVSTGGMAGGLLTCGLFMALAFGMLRIARVQEFHEHAFWLVVGLTLLLGWQSALNMGATIGIFPLTGIPLSFVGRGTVAMIVNGAIVGLVLAYRGGARGGELLFPTQQRSSLSGTATSGTGPRRRGRHADGRRV